MPATQRSGGSDGNSLFVRNFLKHPFMLGAPSVSSPHVVRRIVDAIDPERARVVVEYGPGVGTITEGILERLPPEGAVLALEKNRDFVEYLRAEHDDKRLHVVNAPASQAPDEMTRLGLPTADYVVSGIPFSWLTKAEREATVEATRRILKPDGRFIVYQATKTVLPYLERSFSEVDQEREPRNSLPMNLYFCTP